MENIKKVLKGILLVTIIGITTFGVGQKANASVKNDNEFNIVDYYTNQEGGKITEYSDGSFAYVNVDKEIYEFTSIALGDYNYSFSNIDTLNECIKSYASCINKEEEQFIYVCNSYMDNNDMILEYSDNSYCIINNIDNKFEFFPSLTNDYYCISFDNSTDLMKCIYTYKAIKEGTY